jgi:RNA polymerase sigma-B factor
LSKVLSERDRGILLLRFRDGLTQREIGDRVGLSQMHVSRLIRAGLERLQEEAARDLPASPASPD